MQYCGDIRQKDQYEVKWFIPLVDLSLEDRLLSPGLLPVFTIASFVIVVLHALNMQYSLKVLLV